jgi:indole-3-glycerol phosphate synthase/phosphoribosylanthranilate isomerase
MLPVGVFRDAPQKTLVDIAMLMNLHAVQLHGHEDFDYVRTLRRELPAQTEIWTALSVGREPLIGRGGDRIIFDNADGGTGRTFDWALVEKHPELSRGLVAGGIGAHNAREAAKLGAYALDIGSAVDLSPGQKSPEKIGALFDALRPISRERLNACA